MRKIETYYEPLKVLKDHEIECEMTDSQLAFLCGLIKDKQPKKIVEVGVAHGGTTCVILQCLKEIGITTSLHSVDISKECYRASGKRTGYAVDMAFPELPHEISHFWHLGNALPCYLEEIGGDIDFLILDTVHSLPGEMLDFLAALPYLSPNAVVVLHDITLNQITYNEFGYATRIVYETAVAEKIIADGVDPDEILPGIGAFQVTNDTIKYIEKCFSSLSITWKYDLPDKDLEQYRTIYRKFYDTALVELFDKTIAINRKRMLDEKQRKEKSERALIEFHKCVTGEYKIVLYGGGFWAELITQYLHAVKREADAYIVSDNADISACRIKDNIFHYSDLPYPQEECCLIMAIDSDKQKSVSKNISANSFRHIFCGEGYVYDRLEAYIKDVVILKKAGDSLPERMEQ
ncbi:MAG: class I SAM-dependent methyltransferase [Lachnospiraceae bacterium]|nr:class I SAM-dependent methyltransferase [Lachnospiraceae bacterium]